MSIAKETAKEVAKEAKTAVITGKKNIPQSKQASIEGLTGFALNLGNFLKTVGTSVTRDFAELVKSTELMHRYAHWEKHPPRLKRNALF